MTPARKRAFLAAASLGLAAAWPAAAAAADLPPPLLAGSPLVLKDGRMAYVTVQTVPFPAGAEALPEDLAGAVAQLATSLATDCFLTAQAIGHVDPGAQGEGDTLASHRLARARADSIQQALAAKGLPAAAVASAWDWQFLIREPRVTLWVFQMRVGEDCAGEPLPAPQAVAAQAEADPPPVRLEGPSATHPMPEEEGTVAAEPTPPEPEPAEPPPTLAALEPEPIDEPAEPLAAIAPAAEAEVPPPPPAEPLAKPAPVLAALPAEAPAPALEPEAAGPPLEIVFDTNSSYFPQGAGRTLKEWAGSLPPARGYRLEIEAAVDAGDVRAADQAQAARYSRWLAERRIGRVQEWLERNIEVRALEVAPSFLEGDSARCVVVRARPLP